MNADALTATTTKSGDEDDKIGGREFYRSIINSKLINYFMVGYSER